MGGWEGGEAGAHESAKGLILFVEFLFEDFVQCGDVFRIFVHRINMHLW